MRKVIITVAAIAAIIAAIIGISAIAYANSENYNGDRLPDGLTVNGTDCSGMTCSEAAERLSDVWNHKHLQVVGRLGETLADYTDFGCTYDIEDQLSTIKQDHFVYSALNHYLHIPFSTTIAMKVDKCSDDFADRVRSSDFLNQGNVIETTDAYVDLDDPTFPIIAEVYGNKTDEDSYLDDVLHAVSLGSFRFEFDENAYISIPEIKSDDPGLLKYQSYCREFLGQKISYRLGKESFTLTARELGDLMKDDLSGNADETKVKAFAEKLKKKYDITGPERTFTSLTGRTFKVSGGDYGWLVDADGEAAQLTEDINSHKDVKREPVFSQKGQGEYSRTLEIGDTYIDVDLKKQHVYYFENGSRKWDADCVSGCWAAGHSTPTGVYDIKGKGRGITLTSGGNKKDPGYYESYVSYWMPFLGNNYGLHDASWRSNFGGDIYRYSGSHGCVNLPPAKAGKLYDLIDIGTIVIIHE